MHATNDRSDAAQTRRDSRWRFYRAIWRWHFYAGLLVLPFITLLAVTGAAFLYQDVIDRSVHHALKVVQVGGARLPAEQLVGAARQRYGGRLFVYTTPDRADASAEVGLVDTHGVRQVVYVDPYRARVLGALPEHGTLSWTIRRLHSLALVGPYARGLIEMAGGWTIVLVLTGVYLWWPRGRGGGVISVRGKPRQRLFWRDLHAVTGAGVGTILLVLALTGMPWSWLWGAQVNRWVNGHDFGYPAGLRVQQPMSHQRLADSTEPAWSLRQARLPESVVPAQSIARLDQRLHGEQDGGLRVGNEHSGHTALTGHADNPDRSEYSKHLAQLDRSAQHVHGAIGLDAAMTRFDARGITPGYSVAPPRGVAGVYTASVYPADLQQQRVIHLDQYSGAVLLDMRYRDYGPLAKLMEWGINVHLGQQYGTANRLILLFACIAIVLLCVSAAVMWYKRRPSGGLGVPPLPADPRTLRGVLVLLVLCGLVFPLVGLSLLLLWAFDRYWMQRVQADASAEGAARHKHG